MSTQKLMLTPVLLLLFSISVRALSVLPGSPCFDTCNGGSPTTQNDIVCTDNDFDNTEVGQTLSSCLTCLHASDYQNGFATDSVLFLYYLSSIQQTCLGNSEATGSCSSSCSGLAPSFSNLGSRNQFQNPYLYCSENNNVYLNSATQCSTCLQSGGSVILGNVVYVGQLGCETTPSVQDGDDITYSGNLFGTSALGSTSTSNSRTSSEATTSVPKSTSPSHPSSRTSDPTVTVVSSVGPGSVTVVLTATMALTPTPTSNTDTLSAKQNATAPLSRGAAAGLGIVLGLLGIAGIVALAIFLRRRQMRKNGPFQRMPSPVMAQRSPTPPAAGVFLPPGHQSSSAAAAAAAVGAFARTGIGRSIARESDTAPAPKDIGRSDGIPKQSRSFRSGTSRSWRSKNVTPRSSAWFYAANPKTSSDLTALPQPIIVPGMGGIPEVPASRGTLGRGWE